MICVGRTISLARICSDTSVLSGDQVNRVAALAMEGGKSVDFTGCWRRHISI